MNISYTSPNPWLVHEAIASVALEHPVGHDCRTCLAARGDTEAFLAIFVDLMYHRDEEARR